MPTKPVDPTFQALRALLEAHAAGLRVAADTPERFSLEAVPGPATISAWRGQVRRSSIPVAWVERSKAYVGYHLMGLDGDAALASGLSPSLRARKQGKTCFNFREADPALFAELAAVTAKSIDGLRRGGFIAFE